MSTAIRQEIHGIIGDITERNLDILRPPLDFFTDKGAADDRLFDEETELLEQCRRDRKKHPKGFTSWTKVRIEPTSPEERAMVEERVREYHEDPSSFVPLESIR